MITTSTLSFSADAFTVTAVEPWFKVKVQVLQEYLQAFTSQTVGLADEIVFIDLFAGSGFYTTGFQKQLIPMPALQALSCDPPFTKLIFCEQSNEAFHALKVRVNKYFRGRNVVLFDGELDELVEKFRVYVPTNKKNYKVATVCLIDPFSFNYSFALIQKLAEQGYSFIVPYTFQLNARTDYRFYIKEHREKLMRFLGHNYTSIFTATSNADFYKKLVRIHQNNMLMLGLHVSIAAHKIESKQMDLPVFYVGFFSKLIPSKSIIKEVKESERTQFSLF